ncbi:type I polyketide synthase [Sorangium sp. So ce260]|uniref:type I polyketide synthase n=1 Tax=Sorangium sp. So ce260 TaxID=3133291 RepID=UPI003F637575
MSERDERDPTVSGSDARGEKHLEGLLRDSLLKIRELKSKLRQHELSKSEPIAIIGLGCRFPGGGTSPGAFWQALRGGVDAIRAIPSTRWPAEAIPAEKHGARWAGLLDAVDGFDARFFGIAPREAASLDPQQRLLLEVAWEALEDAGQPSDRLMGSRSGVFMGLATLDYQQRVTSLDPEQIDAYCGTGNLASTAAGRLSYILGLEGPCVSVDTACSSSLVAVHLACQSLRSGESDLSLAGGVSLILSPATMCMVSETQALSPDGRCKTFDAAANGYVRAEGCGVVVLKRLSDAQRDGDRVWAVVRGSAINQDGRSTGLTAPNVLAQQALLRQALESAGVAPADVGYIEAHGTGTSLGDPIELEALKEVLGQPRADGSMCAIGSVKTNLGHLEAAAGVAGLIKAVLSLHHRVIPRHLHFRTLNPRVSLEGTPFVIPAEELPWTGSSPRFAGVSSFGASGTNAHVVLEEARPWGPATSSGEGTATVLPLSAKTPEALSALAQAVLGFLRDAPADGTPSLGDVAYTAGVRRTHHAHRMALVASSRQQLIELLEAAVRGETPPGVVRGDAGGERSKRVVFVFPGQGSQWLGMGRRLLEEAPAFRAALEGCDRAIREEAGFSVLEELAAAEERSRLGRIDVVQPVLFAIEVALAALWRGWGVEPSAVVGHSMGEVAAAHVAGALTLEDAARVVCRRSRLLGRVSGRGAMALVELPVEEATRALRGREHQVSIAVSNGPRSTVLSGEPGPLEEILVELERARVFCRRVKVDVASHSPQMDPLLAELRDMLGGLSPRAARVPLHSTVTGGLCGGAELGAGYWARNLREPVLFSPAIERLSEGADTLFLELSPHPILVPAIEEVLRERDRRGAALASLRREQDERRCLLESLGALYVHGAPVDWGRIHPQRGRCVSLPAYPWQRERHWLPEDRERGASRPRAHARSSPGGAAGHPLLGAPLSSSVHPGTWLWQRALSLEALPYLSEHRIRGDAVLSGTAYLEMALAAAAEVRGGAPLSLEHVAFERVLVIPEEGERTVQVVLAEEEPGRASIRISSLDGATWIRHATGTVRTVSEGAGQPRSSGAPREIMARCEGLEGAAIEAPRSRAMTGGEHYERMAARGLSLGASFRGVEQLWMIGATEVLGRVRAPDELSAQMGLYELHPALLDACFQVLSGLLPAPGAALAAGETHVLAAVERVRVHRRPGRDVWVHGRMRPAQGASPERLVGDLHLIDDEGQVLVEVLGLRAERIAPRARGDGEERSEGAGELLYALEWRRRELEGEGGGGVVPRGAWLVLSDRGGTGAALSAQLERRGEATVRAVAAERYERVEPRRYRLDPSDASGYAALLGDAFSEEHPCRGVVHLFGLDGTGPEATSAETLVSDQRLGSLSALLLAKALVRRGWRDMPRLYLVTRGVQAAGPEASVVRVSQAPLWGVGRVVGAEHPELGCTRVDLGEGAAEHGVEALVGELLAQAREPEVALRPSGRYVARLARGAGRAGGDGSGVRLRGDGTYLITGGLGGLGLSVGRWMVDRGARHLVLVGRSGATERARAAMREMEGTGAQVLAVQADVAQRASVERLLSELGQRLPPLRGVVHAAGVAVDSTVEEETEERLFEALGPKMQGAWNLHSLLGTREAETPLDFFVLYSSAMSVLGPPGSVNYAAADAFLDALAHHRRAQGLAATSINWGLFSDVGAAARSGAAERMASRGMPGLTEAQGTDVLARMLAGGEAQALAMQWNLRQWLETYPSAARSPLWTELHEERERGRPSAADVAGFRQTLERESHPARLSLLEKHLGQQLGRVLRLDAARIGRRASFSGLGMDSLMGLELRNRLESSLGIKLSATLLFTYPDVASLAEHLLGKMTLSGGPPEPPAVSAAGAPPGDEPPLAMDELLAAVDAELSLARRGK